MLSPAVLKREQKGSQFAGELTPPQQLKKTKVDSNINKHLKKDKRSCNLVENTFLNVGFDRDKFVDLRKNY